MDFHASDLDQVWSKAMAEVLAGGAGAASAAWLHDTEAVGLSDGIFVLSAPSPFARDQLDRRLNEPLSAALTNILGEPVTVVITAKTGVTFENLVGDPVDDRTEGSPREPDNSGRRSTPDAGSATRPAPTANLSAKYVFDRFVIGDGNRFAHAAAFAVAESPAKAYNPLFIYGGSGLGKTHLLQAIGHYTTKLYPGSRVTYITSEQFTSEFIEAVRSGQQSGFQRRYRDVDVLLIDDIQFFQKAERTQEEFFHTFNALHHDEKQIVLTSDRPPRHLHPLEARLRTRFEMGLITDVRPPDKETRLAILRRKADIDEVTVPNDVQELIAERVSSNIRELEGALIRVVAAASLSKRPVTMALAEAALKEVFPESKGGQITTDTIMEETAAYFGFSVEQLCSSTRTRALVNARQIAMYLTRELTELSLPKIGEAFGGRDHTTVMHAYKKIQALIKERPATFEQIQDLTSHVKLRASG